MGLQHGLRSGYILPNCRQGWAPSPLERLTGDTINISQWLEFDFYDLVWFWNNHSDDTNPMLGPWLGVSNRVGSALCYWTISEKVNVLSRNAVQHLNAEEPSNTYVQERIHDYHGSM